MLTVQHVGRKRSVSRWPSYAVLELKYAGKGGWKRRTVMEDEESTSVVSPRRIECMIKSCRRNLVALHFASATVAPLSQDYFQVSVSQKDASFLLYVFVCPRHIVSSVQDPIMVAFPNINSF